MQKSGNTVLITGGTSGIGMALAERFHQAGSTVIVCSRRAERLEELSKRLPGLHTIAGDVSDEAQRIELFRRATSEFPGLNVLVNNAGIQQRLDLKAANADWPYYRQEIASNFDAPVHLTLLFLPHLLKQPKAAVINVYSGLSIVPGVWVPIYSATKAALHSFTVSLRIQLEGTGLEVLEILPPAVNTDLGGAGLHTFGAPLDAFADSVFGDLDSGKEEIGYGGTEERLALTAAEAKKTARGIYEGFRNAGR